MHGSKSLSNFRFGTESRGDMSNPSSRQVPGPGNYHTAEELGKNAPKFSFGKDERGDESSSPYSPGPGQYQHKTHVGNSGPKFTMGGNRPLSASHSHKHVPGVGQYNVHMNDRAKSPSYKIGSASRDGFKYTESNPGPGQYTPGCDISNRPKSPAWRLGTGKRRPLTETENVPGPGNYNTSGIVGGGPKVIMRFN